MFVGVRLKTTNVLDEAEQASSKISLQKLIRHTVFPYAAMLQED